MNRNKKGQFSKEEPYSRIASLCGLILIIAGVGITLLNLCRVDKKIETTIRLDREMIEYTRQIVVAQEQQAQAEKALSESVEEVKKEVKEVKKEVVAVKKIVSTIKKQNDYFKIEEAAKKVCSEKGYGKGCVADILGIAYAEHTTFDCSGIGDGGSSHGCFQIYRKVHKSITVEQANNIEWSARWTLNRLESYGYPTYRSYSIRKHNGDARIPATAIYLSKVNKFVEQYN